MVGIEGALKEENISIGEKSREGWLVLSRWREDRDRRKLLGWMFGEKMREKEGEPQGTALFPACERGCPWLAACQVCLHHCCKWIESKVPKYAPGKDTEHLQWGLDCPGCPAQCPCTDGLSPATGHLQPHCSILLLEKGSALTKYPNWTFLGAFKGQDSSREFCKWLGKASWYFKIEASFLSLAKVPGNIFLFDSSVAALISCDITRAATPPAKLFQFESLQDTNFLLVLRAKLHFGLRMLFWLFKTGVMTKSSWLGGGDQGTLWANGSWFLFFK